MASQDVLMNPGRCKQPRNAFGRFKLPDGRIRPYTAGVSCNKIKGADLQKRIAPDWVVMHGFKVLWWTPDKTVFKDNIHCQE
jgi:hypothetical protein